MKCPKCGFTSFDFLENCKKCGQDLQGHKSKFGLRSLIFPNLGGQPPAAEEASDPVAAQDSSSGEGTDFGFDFMSEEATVTEVAATEPPVEAEEKPADEEEEDDFSFAAADEADDDADADDFEFVAEDDSDDADGFEFSEEEPADDFDFSEDDSASETTADDDSEDEFAFTETDEELDGELAAEDIDFSDTEEEKDELDDWDEEDEEDKEKKKDDAEDPSDPFDLRGSAELERAPGETPLVFEDDAPEEPQASSFIETLDEAETETESVSGEEESVAQFSPAHGVLPEQTLFGFQDDEDQDADALEFDHDEVFASLGKKPEAITPAARPAILPRLAAGGCDLIILCVVFLLFLMAGELTLSEAERTGLLPSTQTLLKLSGPYFLVFFALCFGYFTLFHFLTGQTPGKMLFGLRVEDLAGSPLSFSQAFLRSVGGLFSLLPAGLGFLAILFSKSRRGWSDLLAGSQMVLINETVDDPFEELSEF